jgi:hypothetical protein
LEVEGHCAETDAAVDQQARHVLPVLNGNAKPLDAINQGVQDRAARVVAGVAGAAPAVCAEEALIQAAVGQPGKVGAPLGHLVHAVRSFPHQDLDRARACQSVAFVVGVCEVLLPGILWIDGRQRGIDAACRQDGVCVAPRPLADDDHCGPRLMRRDGRAQPRAARSDNQNVTDLRPMKFHLFSRGSCGCVSSLLAPLLYVDGRAQAV